MERLWKVSDFKPVNKAWGNYRKLVAKIDIANGTGFIGLFRENEDGRESICVHQASNNYMITKLGMYWVDTDDSKQKALDTILETLLAS